ncbi:hypothetical protein WT01_19095 [Burkholderia cepacia]|nr:hypothetical protein WT01_19095 [Burkholderia cepacia]
MFDLPALLDQLTVFLNRQDIFLRQTYRTCFKLPSVHFVCLQNINLAICERRFERPLRSTRGITV